MTALHDETIGHLKSHVEKYPLATALISTPRRRANMRQKDGLPSIGRGHLRTRLIRFSICKVIARFLAVARGVLADMKVCVKYFNNFCHRNSLNSSRLQTHFSINALSAKEEKFHTSVLAGH